MAHGYAGSHRGWTLILVKTRNVVRCRLKDGIDVQADMPHAIDWPSDDPVRAAGMIDVVMDRDLVGMRRLKVEFPTHLFGFELLLGKVEATSPLRSRVIKTMTMPYGHRLDIEVVETHNHELQLRAALRRGDKTLAAEIVDARDLGLDDRDEPEVLSITTGDDLAIDTEEE